MSEHRDMGWTATKGGTYRLVDLVYVESLALWLRAVNRWPGDCQRTKERA